MTKQALRYNHLGYAPFAPKKFLVVETSLTSFEIKNEDEEIFKEEYNLWEDFKNEILYKNRFIIKHILLDYVTKVAENNIRIISEGTKLYRARKYTESRL